MAEKSESTALAESAGVSNPMVLLRSMIDRGFDTETGVAALRDMMALVEQWEKKQALAAYNAAMAACQKEMPIAVRDGKNPKTNSRFASMDSVNPIAKPVYTKHGFAISFSEEPPLKADWIRTVADIRHEKGHVEKKYLELPADGLGPKGEPIGGMNRVQGACSTATYAQRRLLCGIFNITIANEDRDGNGSSEPITVGQIEIINNLLEERALSRGKSIDMRKFLEYVGVDEGGTVGDISSKRFDDAVQLLKDQIAEGKKR